MRTRLILALLLLSALGVLFTPVSARDAAARQATTPIIAVTATPKATVVPASTATGIRVPSAVPLTVTVQPSATVPVSSTVAPAPSATPQPSPTYKPPVVQPWATATPQSLLPVLSESPLLLVAVGVVAAGVLFAILLMVLGALAGRQRRKQEEAGLLVDSIGSGAGSVSGAQESLALPLGFTLGGRYVVGNLLGRGGLGTVYKAWDSLLDRSVALKVIRRRERVRAREDGLSEGEAIFYEARTTAQLQHDNIVAVYDLQMGGEDIPLYVVMELLDGVPLSNVMGENPGVPLADDLTLAVVTGVLRALDYAHGMGVLHRDLKPANIMLIGAGQRLRVKVLDFGFAYLMRRRETMPTWLREGKLVGSLQYMAPEQLQGVTPAEAGDLYSLGVLFYQMVAGRNPFIGKTAQETVLKQVNLTPEHPRTYREDLRPEAAELILHLLSKQPRKRPASAAEVLEQVMAFGGRLSTLPLPPGGGAAPATE